MLFMLLSQDKVKFAEQNTIFAEVNAVLAVNYRRWSRYRELQLTSGEDQPCHA
jgi:hypothetical protein